MSFAGIDYDTQRSEENTCKDVTLPRQHKPQYRNDATVLEDLIREIWEETDSDTIGILEAQQETTEITATVSTSPAVVGNQLDIQNQEFNSDVSRSEYRDNTKRVTSAPAIPLHGSLRSINSAGHICEASNGVNSTSRFRGSLSGVNGVPRLRGSSARGRISPIQNIQQYFNDNGEEEDEFQNDRSRRESANGSTRARVTNDENTVARVKRDRSSLRHVSSIQFFKLTRAKFLSSSMLFVRIF